MAIWKCTGRSISHRHQNYLFQFGFKALNIQDFIPLFTDKPLVQFPDNSATLGEALAAAAFPWKTLNQDPR